MAGRARAAAVAHTCYLVGDLAQSAAFYGRLGFTEQRRFEVGEELHVFLGLPGDGERVELVVRPGERPDPGGGYLHLALIAPELDRLLAALDVSPERGPVALRSGGPRLAFVRDPDGYLVELIEPAIEA